MDPLDLAVLGGHHECAAMLCQAGLTIKQKHLQLAHEKGKHKIYVLLRKKAIEQGNGVF